MLCPLDLSAAFGKLDKSSVPRRWHPLADHMADVAAVFETLCECAAIRRALERAARRPLDTRDIQRLTAIAFLHDIGKANSGFQAKRWDDDDRPRNWPTAGHGAEAIALLDASNHSDEAESLLLRLPVVDMLGWGSIETVGDLLRASISHHGRPIPNGPDWPRARIHWTTRGTYDPAHQIESIGIALQLFSPTAFQAGGIPLPDAPRFAHLFAGLVQLADWLGSDERFFPYSEPGELRTETSRNHARKAVREIGLDVVAYRGRLISMRPSFAAVFDTTAPYPAQAAMADATLDHVVVLEAETGSGKTEASLWRFVQLFARGEVDGLYFALPTRVAASQVYARVLTAIERLWPSNTPVVVRALPGYVSADGATTTPPLPDFRVLWSDEPNDADAARRWSAESPKRFLAATVAVGTIDQLLLGTLQVKHAHLRHALAARSLLVIDEVHASDAYMSALIERLIDAQTALGGHVLLLSATLGAVARTRYLSCSPQKEKLPNLAAALTAPYPAISDATRMRATRGATQSKRIDWKCADIIDHPDQVAAAALDAANQGAKVLVIRNTVPSAIATLGAIEAAAPDRSWLFSVRGVVTLHHSRFAREDRPLLDAMVEEELGKRRSPGPMIVIGTQTLEQSLDLDADFLITDLCPMDVMLQRIGRLHRHARAKSERPIEFRDARVIVLTPGGSDLAPYLLRARHGLGRFRDGGGVYADLRILETTRRLVSANPIANIPEDNRRLVESATHPEALADIEALSEAWATHGQQVDGDTGARRTGAKLGLLPLDAPFDEGLGFPPEVKLATRLGAADRVVCFGPPLPGPFGRDIRELPIRHHMLPQGLTPEAEAEDITLESGGFRFRLGSAHYRYSRVGLERCPTASIPE